MSRLFNSHNHGSFIAIFQGKYNYKKFKNSCTQTSPLQFCKVQTLDLMLQRLRALLYTLCQTLPMKGLYYFMCIYSTLCYPIIHYYNNVYKEHNGQTQSRKTSSSKTGILATLIGINECIRSNILHYSWVNIIQIHLWYVYST